MIGKKFTSRFFRNLVYEIIDEKWLDKDTFVVVFQDMQDVSGDTYHCEAEYHKDEKRITFTAVYNYQLIDEANEIPFTYKQQIEEYILQKVGVLREGSMLNKKAIAVGLTLDIPQDMSVGELREWLESLKVEIVHTKSPKEEKVRVLKIENLGISKW